MNRHEGRGIIVILFEAVFSFLFDADPGSAPGITDLDPVPAPRR